MSSIKINSAVFWLCLSYLFLSNTAQAAYTKADCLALVKVKSWKGTYTITGSHVGSGSGSGFGYQWDFHSSWTGQVTVNNTYSENGPPVCGAAYTPGAISLKQWYGPIEVTSSTGTASGKETVTNTCQEGDSDIIEYPSVTGQPNRKIPNSVLNLNLADGTYSLGLGSDPTSGGINPGELTATKIVSKCMPGGKVDTYSDSIGLGPYPSNTAAVGTLPGAGSASMALKGSRTYQQRAPWGVQNITEESPATWTETWDLQPVTSDIPTKTEVEDPCLQAGSIIGCENQSLGEVVPVAGTPYQLHYQSDRTPGNPSASSTAIAFANDLAGWTLNVQNRYDFNSNILYLGTGGFRSSASLGNVTASVAGGFLIATEDGRFVDEFNTYGYHLKTLNALTGATVLTFNYDATAGWLKSVVDGNNNITTFPRTRQGKLASIIGPYGQVSKVTLNKQGYMAELKNPAGKSIKAQYAATGLLTAFTNGRGMTAKIFYDTKGLLAQDRDPANGRQVLAANSAGDTVTHTSAAGRVTSYKTITNPDGSIARTVIEPSGLITSINKTAQLATTTNNSNGVVEAATPANDSRFGSSASIPQAYTITTPAGLANQTVAARINTLSNANDLLSLTQQTETLQLNGNTFTTLFDAASKTFTDTSPLGRHSISSIDSLGRILSDSVPGNNSINFSYNNRGLLAEISTGEGADQRNTLFNYNNFGYLQSATDALGNTKTYRLDKLGQILQQTLANGSTVKFTYDAGGYAQTMTNPVGKTYGFGYTKTGLLNALTFPTVKGSKNKETYAYNSDGQLVSKKALDGKILNYNYDNAGRLSNLVSPSGNWSFAYDASRGYLNSVNEPSGINLVINQDGALLQSLAWTGGPFAATQTAGFSYNADFKVHAISLNNANPISYDYDADGLISRAGDLLLTHNAQNTNLSGITLGGVTDEYTYNAFGKLSHFQVAFKGSVLMSVDYVYDKLNRITQLTESLSGGAAGAKSFGYDAVGQLINATDAQARTNSYSYDKNGNRLNAVSLGQNLKASYDAQDRLLTYGSGKYAYSGNGELISLLQNGKTSQYGYDALGQLLNVVLPTGVRIDYQLDGLGRRVGKKVNGNLRQAFVYQNQYQPIAELDSSGNLLSRFVYATHSNVPDYMIRNGIAYRIITDQLGSPRLVVNSVDGSIAQRLDFDEFGNVLQDTQPGFQPFGFAGGLYDVDSQLAHFGEREYDAKAGRWLTKDPIGLNSGATNLYAYVGNDPVNYIDIDGLAPVHVGGEVYVKSHDTQPLVDPNASADRTGDFLQPGDKVTWLGQVPSSLFDKIGYIRVGKGKKSCEMEIGYTLRQNLSATPPNLDIKGSSGPMSSQAFSSSGATKG
jgi:RHS repeat-associated protein